MIISKKIKVEISPFDAATLEFTQGKCRAFYNWWVMKLRNGEFWPGVYAAKKTLKESRLHDPEHHEKNKARNRAVYNDWGLYTFMMMLTYKCQLYGKELIILDESNTSKTCSGCGNKQPMPLWKRTYCCPKCGLVMDRDENSAVNILTRYLARLGPHTQEECGVLQEDGLDVAGMGPAQVA